MLVQPIETRYKGYRFRSRLEARWAVFFDFLGIRWSYEIEGYQLKAGWYLPDFKLHNVSMRGGKDGIWAEVKPFYDRSVLPRLYELSKATHCSAVLLATTEPVGCPVEFGDTDAHYEIDGNGGWDNCMFFFKCQNRLCGHVKIEYFNGSYMNCPRCGTQGSWNPVDILEAETQAKAARFGVYE